MKVLFFVERTEERPTFFRILGVTLKVGAHFLFLQVCEGLDNW